MKDLEGKLALVTGGAKGVGKVIVRKLVERGAHVIVNYFHSHDAAKQFKAELEASGANIEVLRASVAQKQQVVKMFAEVEQKFGHLDILINNAASGALVPAEAVEEEHFSRALDTNLKGSFWCARQAAPLMAKRGGGMIVNISSIGAGFVPANYLVVGTSKAALEALTRYLAVEYAPLNIRVNTASATLIEGDVARLFPRYEEMWKASIDHTPMGRLATADDLAGIVMFLTSDQSRWVTGQTVLADGGLSLSSVALSPPSLPRTPPAAPPEAPLLKEEPASPPAEEWNGSETEDIAIVGMGLAVPGANNPEEYWRVLMEGPDLFRNVPPDRWDYRSYYSADAASEDKSYQSRSVFITDFEPEPELRQEIERTGAKYESTTLWLRHSLIQALKGVKRNPNDRFSFAVGYTADGSQHLEEATVLSGALRTLEQAVHSRSISDEEKERLFRDIQDALKARYWRGDSDASQFLPHNVGLNAMRGVLPESTELLMVDTACSSSLYAADLGLKGLLMDKHDIAVCGGSFSVGPRGSVLFAKLHGLSEGGEVRPLDRKCDGVLFSDGAGVVVLKRLKRAEVDGDRILAVLKTCGSSSDGKGKAIYAPSSEGQSIAIARALEHPGVEIQNIDWIVAHATGTPAGDLAEFTTLREMIHTDHPVYVTSNKSLIGHTGWAAGVASLIEVLVGLQKNTIPPQHRFTACPAEFAIETTRLEVPTKPVSWPPRNGAPRMASISGFGFGGTNAHLVVSEYLPGAKPAEVSERAYGERIAIVAWSAHFPGLDKQEIGEWLSGLGKAPARSFGNVYPVPPFEKVRMPPPILRSIDRCQLMVLECAHQLKDQLGGFWEAHREKTGVVVGHMGATRNATLYAGRCYIDDIEKALRGHARAGQSSHLDQVLADFRRETRRMVPTSNENSFPGMMPNVIPARVANYFDLNGLNMTIDTGASSVLSAIEVAARYLKSLDLDMAVVGGINGNSTGEMHDAVKAELDGDLAEGAVLLALVREKTAVEAGIPVLAYLGDSRAGTETPAGKVLHCGAVPAAGTLTYLGAEAAVAALQALHKLDGQTTILCHSVRNGPQFQLRLQPPQPAGNTGPGIPSPFLSASEFAPEQPVAVSRNIAVLRTFPLEQIRAKTEFFPPGTLVLTNMPELLAPLGRLPNAPVILATPAGAVTAECAQDAVLAAVLQAPAPIRHLRVITNLGASATPGESLYGTPQELVTLHDLTFLALKACFENLNREGSSFLSLYLDSVPNGVLHPLAGLFNGTVKSSALELRGSHVLSVFTDTSDVREAILQAEIETSARQYLPTVVYHKGARQTFFLEPAAEQLTEVSPARLGPNSVIVATGGARGITAEILKTIAQHFRPKLYLIGSNRLDQYPEEMFEGTNEEFAKGRPAYIRAQKGAHPEKSLAAVNREYERMVAARTSRQNIVAMERYCGTGNVHYIACDVMDPEAVNRAMGGIVKSGETIDLLICSAGLNRSSSIPVKSLADFQSVRDMKLRGYQNLKHALRSCPPRMWCNFGSFIGLTGQMGETDYSAGNDFLNTAAGYAQRATGAEEFTIGWTLWSTVGLGSHPVFQTFLEKSGLYTRMTTEEGIHHFVREANYGGHGASIVYMGPAEKHALTEYIPHFFRDWETGARPQTGSFYLGKLLTRTEDEMTFERVFDLENDSYLEHHKVNGYATLPGTFVTEIAAEAAAALVPGWKVIALEDAVFQHFLRVYDASRPSPKRIHARIAERREDQVVVQVRVLTDIVGPGGVILVKDKLHFEMKAVLRKEYPQAPHWERWNRLGDVAVPDPYHFPSAPVALTGMFVSTRDTRLNPLGKHAIYDLKLDEQDPVFSSFLVPSVLLDGLARIAVLNYVHRDYLPLVAPASIRRIDLYEAGNDCALSRRYNEIELYSTPREFAFDGPQVANRFVAARPDGRMLVQMKDIRGIVMGYVHRGTGEYIVPEAMNRLLEQSSQSDPEGEGVLEGAHR